MEACTNTVFGRFPTRSVRNCRGSSAFGKIRRWSPAPSIVCNVVEAERCVGSQNQNRLFVFGMGFVGQYVANELKRQGWEVSGTCTTAVKKKKLEEMGFNPILFNAGDPELRCLNTLQDSTHLLVTIPPIEGCGDPVLFLHQDLLQSKLGEGNIQWISYLSSTSVYGDCGGAWVDEDYSINPTSKRAKARLAAEKGWLDLGHDLHVSVHVLRLGGIYGPGRSAMDTIIKHEPLSKEQKMRESRYYTSRIHVADICQAVMASMAMPSLGRIYNVVDDDPAPRTLVFACAQALIKERWPGRIKEFVAHDKADLIIGKEDRTSGKRVSNTRLKKELGVSLLHPTYKSGLQSIADTMEKSFQ